MLDPDTIDTTRPLEMAAFGTLRGHNLDAGHPVVVVDEPEKPGEVTADEAKFLWSHGRVTYAGQARPTPVETPEQAAVRLTNIEPLGDDKFLIRAPWLGEGETVTGREAATARVVEVVAAGLDLHHSTAEIAGEAAAGGAITGDGWQIIEAGSNGYYDIIGPGLTEPERVRGRSNAEQRLAELRGEASGVTEEVPPVAPPPAPEE